MFQNINPHNQNKKIYFFHINKLPINHLYQEIQDDEFVILVDMHPKFDLSQKMDISLGEAVLFWSDRLKKYSIEQKERKITMQTEPTLQSNFAI
jgi:hypothetical protein